MDSTLQSRLHLWRQRNFPTADSGQQLLGIVEEVGELCHAVLKNEQNIRGLGDPEKFMAAEEDAIGDLLIYLSGYCSYRSIDMFAVFEETAQEVMKRDWITWPLSGFPPGKHPDDVPVVSTRIRNSPDQDPNYKRLSN